MHDMARHVSSYHLDLGQLCCGVCSGRALHRIALITSARNTTWVTMSRLPVWESGFRLGYNESSMAHGVEVEGVGHIHRRGAGQRARGPVGYVSVIVIR